MKLIHRTLAGILLAAGFTAQASAEKVVLKVAHFLPAVAIAQTKMMEPWCEKINKESNGQIECQIYPAMQLGGSPAQLLTHARDGIADVVWTLPGYTPGRFPVSEIFEAPFFATDHASTARALWDFTEKNAQEEFAGLKPIAVWTNGPNHFHLRNKDVATADDLKGLKIRAASRLSNKFLTDIGASAMGMPLPQAVEGMSKGVIDGLIAPWEVVPSVKLNELATNHIEVLDDQGRGMATSTMIFVMNKKKYDSLSPELKKVIDDNSGREHSAWVAGVFAEGDVAGRKATEGRSNKISQLPQSEVAKLKVASENIGKEWVADVSKKGKDGQALYDEAVALVKKYTDAK